MLFNEDTFEQAVIELFENMGYTHIYAPDMNRTDYSRPLLDDVLRDCLLRLNRNLPVTAIDEAILKLNDFDAGSLLQKNMVFMDYLQNGITVKYAVKGEERVFGGAADRLYRCSKERFLCGESIYLRGKREQPPPGYYLVYQRNAAGSDGTEKPFQG